MVVENPKARILAVDDEEIVLDSLRKILVFDGYSIDTVERGKEALEDAKAASFDVRELALLLRNARKVLDRLPPGQQQELMGALVKRVEVRPDQVRIDLLGEERWTAQLNREFSFAKRKGRPRKDAPNGRMFAASVDWLPGPYRVRTVRTTVLGLVAGVRKQA